MSSFLRLALAFLLLAGSALAQPVIRSAGVLGNSGEAGDTLVRFSPNVNARNPQSGLGVDASGYLWAFAGPETINRYAADGRQLGAYPLPKDVRRSRQTLAVAGGQVILLGADKLWTLPVTAPAGTAFSPLPVAAKAMSIGAIDNRLALIGPAGELSVFDVVTRQSEVRGTLPEGARGGSIALLPDGSLIIDRDLKLTPEGTPVKLSLPGGTPVWLGDNLYAFAWHTTIHRLNANGSPEPGVVLGGSSGSFIGTLPKDGEIHLPTGLVHLGGDRYATTGPLGVIQLLRWDDQKHAFAASRRIGAIHRSSGLGVDRQGRVWWNCGYWNWTDGPADLPHNTLQMTDGEGWQLAFLASDALTGLASQSGKPVLLTGLIDPPPRERFDRLPAGQKLPAKPTGAVVLGEAGKEDVIFVDAAGEGARVSVGPDGKFRAVRNPVSLKLKDGKPAVTSLGRTPAGGLLAADRGAVVRLREDGPTWVETDRYEGAGAERFGSSIHLATDGARLWVADTGNNRVLLFTLANDGPLTAPAVFTGDATTGALGRPGRISARGDRAVVVDEANQRLIKLEAGAGR